MLRRGLASLACVTFTDDSFYTTGKGYARGGPVHEANLLIKHGHSSRIDFLGKEIRFKDFCGMAVMELFHLEVVIAALVLEYYCNSSISVWKPTFHNGI